MTESTTSELKQKIAGLRLLGADKLDPVRLHYIEVLARRASTQQGRLKEILESKAGQAVLVLRQHIDQAQNTAGPAADPLTTQEPQLSLGGLAKELTQGRTQVAHQAARAVGAKPSGQASTQYFRNTWSRLSVDKRVTKAIAQAPSNAGPMNSHRLVLRSLALMRDISPDYLTRFTAYVDALLCLDQNDKETPAKTAKATAPETGKKPGKRLGRAPAR